MQKPPSPTRVFRHPEPAPSSTRVWPVFLPFAGCPYRCVFCAQDKQTGQTSRALEGVLKELEADLTQAVNDGRGPYELAFYGGTFTALPSPWPERFLTLGSRFREAGLITRIRCSTRPDCVDPDVLVRLRGMGLDMVELGIQSFNDTVLIASGREYSANTARKACGFVRAANMALGIQLLPGLPGDEPGVFLADVCETAFIQPEVARLYPCLVIKGTPLASIWERGGFVPWSVERAVEELAEALPVLWEHDIRVIRLGLPPEGTLDENVLAGPHHPALGQSARGLALFHLVSAHVDRLGQPPVQLDVPRRYQGELMGHGGELIEQYASIGIMREMIRYSASSEFVLS